MLELDRSTSQGTSKKQRLVALGGGLGTLAALFAITEVPGWQAIVVAGSVRLDYRIRGPGRFIVCDQPSG